MERSEYLQRPLIENMVYEISENKIQITCPHTSFLCVIKAEKIPLSEVEQLFRTLKKEVKASGKMKIKGVSKFLPVIRSLYQSYSAAIEQINQYYSEIAEIVHKIESDGLHYGCSDDELYKEAFEKQAEIEKFYYRNSEYSQYINYYLKLQNELDTKCWEKDNMVYHVITLI